MRATILALLLTACEASGPVNAFDAAAYEVTDPYGDSEPACEITVDQSVANRMKLCQQIGPQYVTIGTTCMPSSLAWKACKAATPLACYKLAAGACVLCVQPDAPP